MPNQSGMPAGLLICGTAPLRSRPEYNCSRRTPALPLTTQWQKEPAPAAWTTF